MEITLEKIDEIMKRMNVSYEKAKEALTNANGDVVDALIYLEKKDIGIFKGINEKSNEIIEKLKEVLKKGNVTKVMVEKDGDVLLNLPVTVGAIGLVLGPVATIVGVSAAMVSKYKIKIVKDDGETLDLSEMTQESFNEIKDKMNLKNKDNKDITDEVIKEEKQDDFNNLDK
ncbi:DUF4342 domain-containing protein [Tepidibacter formicigenes]|jgi:hypothetical protein|uniref:DUF4342 domain-containing protein n=1 Tax=Tepidibacter formicigenes DSM 15518 TaxID=1123349 RepID=A0A1M6TA73_9FIRM|nr:DUF4342 domain-containing protein [Tepidibacter formicigenes]SHK53794.1 protein of unknown function [Tepidibacter formicigenes DSM 15518]